MGESYVRGEPFSRGLSLSDSVHREAYTLALRRGWVETARWSGPDPETGELRTVVVVQEPDAQGEIVVDFGRPIPRGWRWRIVADDEGVFHGEHVCAPGPWAPLWRAVNRIRWWARRTVIEAAEWVLRRAKRRHG